jgi:hypothetical protein
MRVVMRSSHREEVADKDPSKPKVSRGLRGLPISGHSQASASSEMPRLKDEAASIERWWKEPRWRHTKRIYSGKFI